MRSVQDRDDIVPLVRKKKIYFHVIDQDVAVDFILFDMCHLLIVLDMRLSWQLC